jgi:penicillin-binding protein 1A
LFSGRTRHVIEEKKPFPRKRRNRPKRRGRSGSGLRDFLRVLGRILATVFSVFIITGCIVGCVLAVTILGMIQDESEIDLTKLELNYTSVIYTKDEDTGVYVEDTKLYGDNGKRVWVNYEEIPDYVIDVTVAAEDNRFWEHQGVDFARTPLCDGEIPHRQYDGGGSTITQQLIKNVTGEDEVRIDRKVKRFSAPSRSKNNTPSSRSWRRTSTSSRSATILMAFRRRPTCTSTRMSRS